MFIIGPTMVGAGKKTFLMKTLRLELVFANTVCYKSTILLIFEAEFRESALDFLSYSESTIGPTLFGPEEKISK